MNSIINLILFKAGWIAVVAAAANGIPLAGTLAVAAVVLVRLVQAENRAAELWLLGTAGAIGLVWESALVGAGLVSYPAGSAVPGLAPYWIVAMWLLFATTLNVSMRWLRRHVVVAVAAGAVGGPLAFYVGASAGAVSFPQPAAALAAIGAGWALLLPLLVRLAVRSGRSAADRLPVRPARRGESVVTNRTISTTLVLALFIGAMVAAPALASDDGASWRFRVLLDDREIGFHRFELAETAEGRQLETEASFDVRILFINAFRYRHRNVEVWDGGCLSRLSAVTDRNGERLEVTGERREPGFAVVTAGGAQTLPGCVASFAYWNPSILDESRLLNTQTGEYEDVRVSYQGDDSVRVGEEDVPADRYRLGTKGGDIELWYAKGDRRWLKLEAPAKGGRRLRYEPVHVPAPDYVDRMMADSGAPVRR